MAKARKDDRGRALRKGEVQRSSDKRYMYTYTDPLGRRKFIYANDLAELREKEKKLVKDQRDGLDLYVAGKATVNDTFDRYLSTKFKLRETTRSNYIYMYDKYVRDTFGRKRIADIKYSDVLQFYLYLLNDEDLALSTLDNINTLLHPTFQLAVRDEIIRKNPSDGVMKEIARESDKTRGVRRSLTIEQQRAFMEYISKPKTEAGIRTVPMLDTVYDAFMLEREEQEENGFNQTTIDGMNGFVFVNQNGGVPNPQSINRTIKRIAHSYNAEEVVKAKRERREPIILPDFSCHHLRHTFCTRLCEHETNLKVIQSIMGHRNIETTMDIYAEATDRKKQQTFENLSKLDIF